MMTDSQPSGSSSFELLDEQIRKWIWQQKWEALRESQEKAIPPILDGKKDVIVSAPTSAGKTEAAFLPILSRILGKPASSVHALYIGPLKALINDQFSRLDQLCDVLEIPVHRWHGDVSSSAKSRLVKNPRGILLITPESLEALLMRQVVNARTIFKELGYVVVDEVHSFVGNERGAQLRSLLHRIESLIERTVPRVGLSATISKLELVAEFLRPGQAKNAVLIQEKGAGAIKAQLKAFTRNNEEEVSEAPALAAVIDHLQSFTAGSHNLIFCNRKSDVELYADALSERWHRESAPNPYCTHHGNLSKEIREFAETRLKDKTQPATCICTSTLEMGIDIGSMKAVGQIGAPPSVASLRQRVGRSGRRGEPSILRMVSVENLPTAKSPLEDRLHLGLIQAIACLELMAEGWCEPPNDSALHLSTLIQQIMSVIVQRGGAPPALLHRLLVDGPFARLGKQDFIQLLKDLKAKELIRQMDDGTLLLDSKGEKIAEHYSFYAAFSTPEEYQLVAESKPIGTLPVEIPMKPGDPLLFAGKRWVVVDIDDERKIINLRRSRGGRPPRFTGEGGEVHDTVRQRMKELMERSDTPQFLDPTARELLNLARLAYTENNLANDPICELGSRVLLFHWKGDRAASTLRLMLEAEGLSVDPDPSILVADTGKSTVLSVLKAICSQPSPEPIDLAAVVSNKRRHKHDWTLGEHLLNREYASSSIDVEGAEGIAERLVMQVERGLPIADSPSDGE